MIQYCAATTGSGAASPTSLLAYRNLFMQLSRDGNSRGSGTSHAMTPSLKPSFRTLWRVGDAVVGRGNAGWTAPKSGRPYSCQNYSQWPPAERTGRGSSLNSPIYPSNGSAGQGTERNDWLCRMVLSAACKVTMFTLNYHNIILLSSSSAIP